MPDVAALIQGAVDLGYDATLDDQQLRFAAKRYRDVNGRRRWPWTEAAASVAYAANSQAVALSGSIGYSPIDSVRAFIATNDIADLEHIGIERMLDLQSAALADRGRPEYWSVHAGSIYFYPIPAAACIALITYKSNPTDLDDTADIPVWPSTFHDILTYGIAADMAARERDWDSRDRWEQQYETKILEMRNQIVLSQRQSPEYVDTSFYEGMRSRT